jgi:thiamine biosynthesis lipoprotein
MTFLEAGARLPLFRAAMALALCVDCLSPSVLTINADTLVRQDASRLSMACVYAIAAYGPDGEALRDVLEEALDEVDRIDRLMSHYRPDSPLSQLNREAAHGAVQVDKELFEFIVRSIEYSRDSEGAFDITVGPLMKAWGFFQGEGRVPRRAELAAARQRVGYQHVHLDATARTIRFDVPGVELDLGGIAKGYAVDRVVDLLRGRGVGAALVSAGGSTVYGVGAPPGEDAWRVELQDPLAPGRAAFTVALRDRALSMAGTSEKFFEQRGRRYGHIMDPRTGRPVRDVLAVAVLSDTGTTGDALDDALFVRGVERGRAYLQRHPGAEAYFFLPEQNRWRLVRVDSANPRQIDHGVGGHPRD